LWRSDVALKIIVVSDFHGSLEAAKKTAHKAQGINAEVLIVCGDITHFGSINDAEKVLLTLATIKKPVFFVPGNCDPPELTETEITGATCIHGKCVNYKDFTFLGVGGGPLSPFSTPFEISEKEIANVLHQNLKNCSLKRWFIVVSHFAPRDTRVDLTYNGRHIGSVSLGKFIRDQKPHIVFCGHVHEGKGIDYIGDTIIVNTGPARQENYAVANFNEKVEVQLDHL
jgi:Icc-related predicted phosphoesterase